jgi:ABC-type transport system involved in cytochrome c biogenesis permease component
VKQPLFALSSPKEERRGEEAAFRSVHAPLARARLAYNLSTLGSDSYASAAVTFLPIVARELRVRARQKSTYRFRVGGALIAILFVMFMLFALQASSSPQTIGKPMFNTLAWLSFAYCLLDGVRNTADSLSEEKRAGTLGLLFLTDLKGYDVVLGKLMATSLNSFYAVLAIFPPLAIPILIGGVTGGEFWRLVLVLANTLWFSLCAGIFVSAISREERSAWGGTFAVIAAITSLPILFKLVPFAAISWLAAASPGVGFVSLFDAQYSLNPGRYKTSLLFVHLWSWVFLIVAPRLAGGADRTEKRAVGPAPPFVVAGQVWPAIAPRRHESRNLVGARP